MTASRRSMIAVSWPSWPTRCASRDRGRPPSRGRGPTSTRFPTRPSPSSTSDRTARSRATCRTTTPPVGWISRTSGARSPASVRCAGRIRRTPSPRAAAPPGAPRGPRHPPAVGTAAGKRPLALTARPSGSYNRGVSGERTVLTYRDYAALPDDGRRYELHDGELSMTPAPGTRHQRAIGALHVLLRAHVEAHRLGEVFLSPVDCILSDTTVVQPDLVYLDPTRAHLVTERAIEGPPTLVVEILSPSTTRIDRVRKRELYAQYGIPYLLDRRPGRGDARGLRPRPRAATRSSRAPPAPAPWRCRPSPTSVSRPPRSTLRAPAVDALAPVAAVRAPRCTLGLVAASVKALLRKRRNSYCPDAVGIVTVHVRVVTPAPT